MNINFPPHRDCDLAERTYLYLGDALTDPALRGAICSAVLHADGKCVRGRNGSMLVEFAPPLGRRVVVGRLLRKTEKP